MAVPARRVGGPVAVDRAAGNACRVLLVEDDPALADMYSLALELRGFVVERARTAAEAWQLGRGPWADVILLDVGLPDRSGLELLRDFRSDPDVPQVAVIIFTNFDDPATMGQAFALGADDYLVKANSTPAAVARRVASFYRYGPGILA